MYLVKVLLVVMRLILVDMVVAGVEVLVQLESQEHQPMAVMVAQVQVQVFQAQA